MAGSNFKWTPRDLFRDMEERRHFRKVYVLVGLFWRAYFGGPEGIRTLDLFHAMEARSQLRHRPTSSTTLSSYRTHASRAAGGIAHKPQLRIRRPHPTMRNDAQSAPARPGGSGFDSGPHVTVPVFSPERVIFRHGKKVTPGCGSRLLTATRDELNTRIANLYNAINSFQATVDMTPSVGSVYTGHIKEIHRRSRLRSLPQARRHPHHRANPGCEHAGFRYGSDGNDFQALSLAIRTICSSRAPTMRRRPRKTSWRIFARRRSSLPC